MARLVRQTCLSRPAVLLALPVPSRTWATCSARPTPSTTRTWAEHRARPPGSGSPTSSGWACVWPASLALHRRTGRCSARMVHRRGGRRVRPRAPFGSHDAVYYFREWPNAGPAASIPMPCHFRCSIRSQRRPGGGGGLPALSAALGHRLRRAYRIAGGHLLVFFLLLKLLMGASPRRQFLHPPPPAGRTPRRRRGGLGLLRRTRCSRSKGCP